LKFADMPYKRPDMTDVTARLDGCTQQLRNAQDFAQAEAAFLEKVELDRQIDTMFSLATIRHTIDTKDVFYSNEADFFDAAMPQLQEHTQLWTQAMLECAFRPDFERKYGTLLFVNAEMELKTFSPAIIEDLQKENALTTEYEKLLASAQIPFEGKTYTIAQMGPNKLDPNDNRRLSAWKAEAGFYVENAARLDEIYDELTKLRTAMARKLGYESYITLGYYRMNRNCYTKEDVERFRHAVVKYLVPVADKIYRRQAQRLGKDYPLSFADAALAFRSGNPKPQGTPDDILRAGKEFYHWLSPETAGFIDFMYENDLLDVRSRTGKAGGGYCTNIAAYRAPFIFANFNGTAGDVEVVTHEAGHAFAAYLARDVIPLEYQWPTMEACEVHSMSMEFFAWPWAEQFFGTDARKFRYTHLSNALTFIPYGTMVDHFQHLVYEKPEMTPAQRHETWMELLGIYMPWLKLDGEIPFYSEGKGWQRQHHIYESPFYYIDYCLAQTVSLRFWAMLQEDQETAWNAYMAYTRPAGTKTFRELVEIAGLESPFGEDSLRAICTAAAKWLDDYDLTGIE